MMLTTRQHQAVIGLSILYLASLLLRIFFRESALINLESDNLFYDAKLVVDGLVPFRDFLTREPVTLYFYAAQIALFGVHVQVMVVVIAVVKACALYFFGRAVFQLIHTVPVTVVAMIVMMFFGVKALPDLFLYGSLWAICCWHVDRRWWTVLLSGALLGCAVMSYRAAVPFGVVITLLIAYGALEGRSLPEIIRSWAGFALGFGITLLLPLFYFIWKTDWVWMSDLFLADQLVIAYLLSLAAGMIGYFFFRAIRSAPHRLAWAIPPILIGCVALFFYKTHPSLAVKIAVLHDFSRADLWVLLPFLCFVVLYTIHFFGERAPWIRWVCWSAATTAIALFTIGTFHTSRGPSVALVPLGQAAFLAVLALLVMLWVVVIRKQRWRRVLIGQWEFLCIAFPAVVLFAASLTYSDWLPSYIQNYAWSIVIGASIMLYGVWQKRSRLGIATLISTAGALVVCTAVFPQLTREFRGFNASVEMRARHAFATVAYIQAQTNPDEEIFTAVPFFALRSGRPLALHLTHPVVYIPRVDDPKAYDPYDVIPSVTQIQEYLHDHQVRYIIQDERTRSLFHSDRHPALSAYITEHYSRVESYGNIKILKRK